MPHSPELIERMLKEAGLFDNVKSWFSGFFGPKLPKSKEQQKALSRADAHFGAKDKDWDKFLSNANRKSFAKAIANDPRADDKLKMHVENMNRLKTGKVLGAVMGTEGSRTARRDGAQSYKIVKLRGSNRLGCTCNDWRYKKSVAQPGEQVDCKHILEFKQMNKTASRLRSAIKIVEEAQPPEWIEFLGKTVSPSTSYKMLLGDRQVGEMVVGPTGHIASSHVSKDLRGMGLGKKLYGEVIRRRGDVKSDPLNVSDAAQRVWGSMKRSPSYSVADKKGLLEFGEIKQPIKWMESSLPDAARIKTAALTYGDLKKEAAELTTRGRNQISEGNFALPGRRYPIHDRSHARNALARVAQHGTPEEKAQVRKAVAAKYPRIGKEP